MTILWKIKYLILQICYSLDSNHDWLTVFHFWLHHPYLATVKESSVWSLMISGHVICVCLSSGIVPLCGKVVLGWYSVCKVVHSLHLFVVYVNSGSPDLLKVVCVECCHWTMNVGFNFQSIVSLLRWIISTLRRK